MAKGIIYKITNLVNGKIYIGQTKNSLHIRWKEHQSKYSNCSRLKSTIKHYGVNNFKIEAIGSADCQVELDALEKSAIETNESLYPKGYNLKSGGQCSKHNDISKQKIAAFHKGRKRSKDTCKKISESVKNRVISDKQKQDISDTLIKRVNVRNVKCLETGTVYRSARHAAISMNLNVCGISKVLNNRMQTTGGYRFVYE